RDLHSFPTRRSSDLDSSDQLEELRRLEDEGDALVRDAVADLFASTDDAKAIIRWKDIHERLEEAVDALENAADVLEAKRSATASDRKSTRLNSSHVS